MSIRRFLVQLPITLLVYGEDSHQPRLAQRRAVAVLAKDFTYIKAMGEQKILNLGRFNAGSPLTNFIYSSQTEVNAPTS